MSSRIDLGKTFPNREARGKIKFWKSFLTKFQNKPSMCWCLIGDVNEVRSYSKRKGRSMYYLSSNSIRFEDFIVEAGLIDIGFGGKKVYMV